MEKYLLNENIHGYDKVTIDNEQLTNKDNILVIIVVDNSCNEDIGKYYMFINKLLKKHNKVILIEVDDGNKCFKPLASLMTTFDQYNIYSVANRESISAKYLIELQEREPDLAEVQTYIGGDVTAYSDIMTIIFGIENLIDEGNEDKLKDFLEEHMISIENLTYTINNMKKTCDIFNSNELLYKIQELKDNESKLRKSVDDTTKNITEVKFDRDKFKVEVENLKRENNKLKDNNSDLKTQAESGGSVIKSYKELNTQLINCKAKVIIYFKEISYIPYINSLVTQLFNVIENGKKLKAKLLIYDSSTELYTTYKPLPSIKGMDYLNMKGTLISKTKQFVIAEPNQSILQDILLSEQCFDVVIVYDRMKGTNDIVSGNNVTKFYVINSNKDYEETKSSLKINDSSNIITHANSNIDKKNIKRQFLDIPFIDGYTTSTATARTSKYMKLVTGYSKLPLIDTILKKSRADTLV